MLLGVKELDEVTVRADGADAIEAIEALIGYLENPQAGLEETTTPSTPAPMATPQPKPPRSLQSRTSFLLVR